MEITDAARARTLNWMSHYTRNLSAIKQEEIHSRNHDNNTILKKHTFHQYLRDLICYYALVWCWLIVLLSAFIADGCLSIPFPKIFSFNKVKLA